MSASQPSAEDVFSAAWQAVLDGQSLDVVLAAYPEHATELAPLLRLAQQMHALPPPALAPDALATLEARLQAAPGLPPQNGRAPSWSPAPSAEHGGAPVPAPRPWAWLTTL